MKLTIHLHPMLKLRISGAIPPLPLCFHGMQCDSFSFYDVQYRHKNTPKNGVVFVQPIVRVVCRYAVHIIIRLIKGR